MSLVDFIIESINKLENTNDMFGGSNVMFSGQND